MDSPKHSPQIRLMQAPLVLQRRVGKSHLEPKSPSSSSLALSRQSVVGSSILFYMAKKRQWEIRKSIRRSARRLTGNFNSKKAQRSSRHQPGVSRLADDKQARKPRDLEKGTVTTITSTFDMEPPTPKPKAWHEAIASLGRKTGR
ncbi:hypothetical protein L228DRAFT_248773 [Xylona heveae TC161]|uniref:Uncharacterized protein n=1 Tax=Xylona heveae (strain CBS 132557 / TC161) TaxID=1328760 RepID=A0A165FIP8_XYLHT|nr:hypothetical protein L228DRAFT_248773 [Xylona heveae TC161]KZF21023.1 hypothetical protein L228DRAFT_248773 [Xylona heveae TC161]